MIAITGATGNVGRHLVRTLAAAGEQVTAVSRRSPAGEQPGDVRFVAADLTDPHRLRPAFDGAAALFLHDGGVSAEQLQPGAILDVARTSGVRKVVLLSSQGVRTRPESRSHGVLMRGLEDAVRRSGLAWTILRPGGFHSNAFAWAEGIRTHRTVVAPFGDVALPTVDPADIAEVAAVALRQDGHAAQVYELTGPAATTPRQRADAIAAALGEPVRFVEQTRAEAEAQFRAFMPAWALETTLAVLGDPTPAEQRPGPVVAQLLGRSPRTFGDWAREHRAAFR